ncbi:hypothetical protein BDZ45DRAFT_733733 [Acephala macrosclerotiorum]|nr:hypothetical protein BDZ45DRAFT_733733 [Acephala macrosclerotiorum]
MKKESIAISSLLLLSGASATPIPNANTTPTSTSSLMPVTPSDLIALFGASEASRLAQAPQDLAHLGFELELTARSEDGHGGVTIVPGRATDSGDWPGNGDWDIEERDGVPHQNGKGNGAPKGNCVIL